MADKKLTNEEIAREIARGHVSHPVLRRQLASEIEAALNAKDEAATTAQSALARDVLAECRNATAGTLNDVTAKDLSDRLRVLFTRLGVKIGD